MITFTLSNLQIFCFSAMAGAFLVFVYHLGKMKIHHEYIKLHMNLTKALKKQIEEDLKIIETKMKNKGISCTQNH